MELTPVPRPPRLSIRARWFLLLSVLTPVTALALVPAMFGLERYVIASDSMDGSREGGIGRGSIVLEQTVPTSRLRVGDVITFRAPAEADGGPAGPGAPLVTHRIVSLDDGVIRTQGDANAEPDPWTLSATVPTRSRVLVAVPWVGYPFLDPWRPALPALLLVGTAGVTALVLAGRRQRSRERELLRDPHFGEPRPDPR